MKTSIHLVYNIKTEMYDVFNIKIKSKNHICRKTETNLWKLNILTQDHLTYNGQMSFHSILKEDSMHHNVIIIEKNHSYICTELIAFHSTITLKQSTYQLCNYQ